MGTQEEDEIIENPHPALDSLAVSPLRVSVDSPLAWNPQMLPSEWQPPPNLLQ